MGFIFSPPINLLDEVWLQLADYILFSSARLISTTKTWLQRLNSILEAMRMFPRLSNVSRSTSTTQHLLGHLLNHLPVSCKVSAQVSELPLNTT